MSKVQIKADCGVNEKVVITASNNQTSTMLANGDEASFDIFNIETDEANVLNIKLVSTQETETEN